MPNGWVVVRDALTMGPRTGTDTVTPHTRPPADDDGDHMLVRTVECIDGNVEIELICEPAFDYGREPATWTLVDDGANAAQATGAGQTVRLGPTWASASRATASAAATCSRPARRPSARCRGPRASRRRPPSRRRPSGSTRTCRFWRGWLGRARVPDHRWRDPVQRSALTIKGLTYMPTGATVAALTTSLPETPGGERNWDYRYTWMRDTTFTLHALHWLNLDWEADEFMQFVADVEPTDDGSLQIMYGIDGRRDLTESTRDDMSGYAGARPVRIGNGAFDQKQNDVFGAVLDSILQHTRESDRLPRRLWPIVESQAECATRVWQNPDQGIWEARGAPKHYVSSKLMGWVALDRAAKLADIRGDADLNATWRATAEEIKADILEHGLRSDGVLRQHYETDSLDASTLLAPIFGFLPGEDERMRASVMAIANELTEDGFVLALQDGRDRRRPLRQGGHLPHLLVLARVGLRDRRRAPAGARSDGAAAPDLVAARAVRGGVRRGDGPLPRQLPAGVLASGADRGRRADHRPRDAEGDTDMDTFDVIIVGTGAGGGTLARHLAPSGKRILLLERGDWLPREPQNWQAADVFVDNRYVSADTWYDEKGKPFQPQIHYFVGGATKLYGAALYRLRAEDFGEIHHHDGVSPAWPITYDELEPYYTKAEQLYEVHGARGEDPTEPPASAPYPFPAVSHEPRIQQLHDDLAAAGLNPFHAPCGIRLERVEPALLGVRPLHELRRLPVRRARQVGRRGLRRAARARAPERHAADERDRPPARDRCVRWHRRARGRRPRRRDRDLRGRHRRARLRRGQHGEGAADVGERRAPERPRQRLRPGRPQLHVPQLLRRARALEGREPDDLPEDARPERLLLRRQRPRVPAREHPDGRQVAGADVPRREARPDEAGAELDAGEGRTARDRLLALDRGPAAAGEPRHGRPRAGS